MKEGLYKLTQDITNPKPDRRYKNCWTAVPVWKKGQSFNITVDQTHNDLAKEMEVEVAPKLLIRPAGKLVSNTTLDELPPEFAEALEPTQAQSIKEAIATAGYYQEDLIPAIEQLVKAGKITYDDVIEAIEKDYEENPG